MPVSEKSLGYIGPDESGTAGNQYTLAIGQFGQPWFSILDN
jgi:hypothetical protein